jgi:O-methyltransferase involved in polyketide biosynthesis
MRLRGEQLTLAIPLYAKALDFRSEHPVLNDRRASELVDQIDFDFESIRSRGGEILVLRARQFDEWVREFLAKNSTAVVLNLGCGLDTRVARIDPPRGVSWIDIDLPDVIQLRREFFTEREGYRMLATSITEPEWLEEIPRHRPMIAVADGVLEYLNLSDVKTLFNRLTDNFHQGQLVFDVVNSDMLRSANARVQERTGATLRWGVDDLREINAIDPRLRQMDAFPLLATKFLPWRYKFLYGISFLFPRLRKAMRLVRFEF